MVLWVFELDRLQGTGRLLLKAAADADCTSSHRRRRFVAALTSSTLLVSDELISGALPWSSLQVAHSRVEAFRDV